MLKNGILWAVSNFLHLKQKISTIYSNLLQNTAQVESNSKNNFIQESNSKKQLM